MNSKRIRLIYEIISVLNGRPDESGRGIVRFHPRSVFSVTPMSRTS